MRKKTQASIIIVLLLVMIALLAYNLYMTTKTRLDEPAIKEIETIKLGKSNVNEFETAAKKAIPAVVSITADDKSGSGVIVREDGIIITNHHVIQDGKKIKAVLSDKRIFSARVIGSDPKADIAVLKINAKNLQTIEFADSDELQVGEKVIAIGQPFGFDSTVTTGIISGKHRDRGPTEYRDFIQTDASINPGNSGGPLVNLEGKLVGINTFIVSGVRTGELGFAIPSNLVGKILDQLLKYGKVTRGYLGVNVMDTVDVNEEGNGMISDGALINGILKDGAAYKAGLKVGDLILEIDSTIVENSNHLRNVVAWLEPGSNVSVLAKRNESMMEFNVTMDTRPDNP